MIFLNHYRHATSILTINEKRILIDPLFAGKGTYPPIQMTKNPKRNPLIDLPIDYRKLKNVDAVFITHNHNDHFDEVAKKELPREIPVLCQNSDLKIFQELGFTNLTAISEEVYWMGVHWKRFEGTHGGGVLKKLLGISSSYLITADNKSIYITGDTLLTGKVQKLLTNLNPDSIIAFGGGARLKLGGKITMSHKDLLKMSRLLPDSQIIAVHMDSFNHCFDTKEKLKDILDSKKNNIIIPDNERIIITS